MCSMLCEPGMNLDQSYAYWVTAKHLETQFQGVHLRVSTFRVSNIKTFTDPSMNAINDTTVMSKYYFSTLYLYR